MLVKNFQVQSDNSSNDQALNVCNPPHQPKNFIQNQGDTSIVRGQRSSELGSNLEQNFVTKQEEKVGKE